MSRPLDRRTFLKGIAVLAAAAPAAALVPDPGAAADPSPADTTATAAPKAGPASYGPDFSICLTDEERALLERQYASALELVAAIRKAPLPPGTEPVTAFAALPRTKVLSATAPAPIPAPGTPRPEEQR